MPITAAEIRGAIQCVCGGPRDVQENMKRPMLKRGATVGSELEVISENLELRELTEEQPPETGLGGEAIGIDLADFVVVPDYGEVC